ncbi:MAG: BatA domain-containing protein [Bacteroidales bacterium]|nr:BatA domain-containing protein [Bacteroidales bacterium]
MEFVNPYFLFGLFAVSIPVIIHLFNFRKFKKVYFTNVKFLRELKQETKKKSQLKHLIILILRILAIICLVLAFAQPYIPLSKNIISQDEKSAVSIFIDNSFSMEARSTNGFLIDEAKNKAAEIAQAYNSSDLFQILTNDFEGRHQRFVSRDEFIEMLDEIQVSPSVKNISDVVKRQNDRFSTYQTENKISYLISDLQISISDIDQIDEDTTIINYFVPVYPSNTGNLYIDSCWFESPVHHVNQNEKLSVRIKNTYDNDMEKIPVKLKINGNQKAIASVDVKAGSETEIILRFTNYETGIQNGFIEITDYPVVYDDIFYFSYFVSDKIPVLCINGTEENIYLKALFGGDTSFVFDNSYKSYLDYSSLKNYKLVIINKLDEISSGLGQELKRFVENGGSLVVLPSGKMDFDSYKNFLLTMNTAWYSGLDTFNTKVDYINFDNEIFNDVFEDDPTTNRKDNRIIDLPVVLKHFKFTRLSRSEIEPLLKIQNGDEFLSVVPSGYGKLYLFAVPFETSFSNFTKHAIFVPVMYKIALLSDIGNRLFYTIGSNEYVELNQAQLKKDDVYKIKKENADFEIIPGQKYINNSLRMNMYDQIKQAGNYMLMNGEKNIIGISFNYDRRESNLGSYKIDDLNSIISSNNLKNFLVLDVGDRTLSQALSDLNKGIQLWKLFIILALIFLAAEVLIIRIWK